MTTLVNKLVAIQGRLKAPKNQRNNFGKYNYRSCEDILEAVKPLLAEQGIVLTITDDFYQHDSTPFIRATATITDGKDSIDVSDLIYEFEMNQISATNKYKDNQITVSGYVDSVGFDIFTNIPQIKITDGSTFAFSGVQCNLSDETQSSGIQAGDKIEVNGVVKEFDLIDVILSNCVVK